MQFSLAGLPALAILALLIALPKRYLGRFLPDGTRGPAAALLAAVVIPWALLPDPWWARWNIPLVAGPTGSSIVREERTIGAVGDHTFTHPLLTSLAPAQAEGEIVRTQRALAHASGGPVFLFRPPYGAHDARIDTIAHTHGLLEILWTVDSRAEPHAAASARRRVRNSRCAERRLTLDLERPGIVRRSPALPDRGYSYNVSVARIT